MVSPWITNLVVVVVASVWTVSLLVGFLQENYTPFTITTPVMLVLAGYAFGVRLIKRNGETG